MSFIRGWSWNSNHSLAVISLGSKSQWVSQTYGVFPSIKDMITQCSVALTEIPTCIEMQTSCRSHT
eukprot:snap_masked-scaffold_6-processed-gene-1.18-mRNA-1 protein AED:1.00 eAED:1.00 QI:0/0/0/0/1/1/2/0/65